MKCLAVVHIADIFREPKQKLPALRDWARIPSILAGEHPRPFPTIETNPYAIEWEQGSAFDTEYQIDTGWLLRWSMATPSGKVYVIEGDDWRKARHVLWPTMRRTLPNPFHCVLQNAIGARDLQILADEVLPEGWPITYDDLRLAHLALWSDWPHTLEFIASMYSPYEKTKHLNETDPVKYSAGDAVDTLACWQALSKELANDPASERHYRERLLPLVPILRLATQAGIRIDRERAVAALSDLVVACADAQTLAQAYAGYPLNVGSSEQVKEYLWAEEGITLKNCEADTVVAKLLEHPEHPLLMARLQHSRADASRKQLAPVVESGAERIHPEMLPAQATMRISVSKPPVTNWIDEAKSAKRGLPDLRSIIIPDDGHWWLCIDYKAMHAVFLAAESGDLDDLDDFLHDRDIHTKTARATFRKDTIDKRERHLAKTVRYALVNAWNPKGVLEAKDIAEQGLSRDELVKTATKMWNAKPQWAAWKRQMAEYCIQRGEVRGLYGNKRRLLGQGDKAYETKAKAAVSGFLQLTETAIMFETLIEVCRRYPEARLVYPSHDGVKIQYPLSTSPWAVYADLKPWVEREHVFNGRKVALPATFEVVRL